MNYLDALAEAIMRAGGDDELPGSIWFDLYRWYAVLALVKGEDVTLADVHDAWSGWCAAANPTHHSLVPFHALTPEVQAKDAHYRDAIRRAVRNGATAVLRCDG